MPTCLPHPTVRPLRVMVIHQVHHQSLSMESLQLGALRQEEVALLEWEASAILQVVLQSRFTSQTDQGPSVVFPLKYEVISAISPGLVVFRSRYLTFSSWDTL